jgi:hypothetical protein
MFRTPPRRGLLTKKAKDEQKTSVIVHLLKDFFILVVAKRIQPPKEIH